MKTSLYIVKSFDIKELVLILRSIIIYGNVIVLVLSKSKEKVNQIINSINKVLKLLNLRSENVIVLKYPSKSLEANEVLEFIKRETSKKPEILISGDPEIYEKFYNKLPIDHLDGLREKLDGVE